MLTARLSSTVSSVVLMLVATLATAQSYPTKSIRLVTTAPGSGNDLIARLLSPGLTDALGQSVVVDNRGGGSGAVAGQIVAHAPPDGHTLLSYGSPFWIVTLFQPMPYDPIKDFSPIMLTATSPNILVVHPSLPVKTVRELIALAKARPGELNYASGQTGSSNHMAAELFKSMSGINIVRIPFKGTGPALTALIGGHMQLMFPNAGAALGHVKAGKLRALAVASAHPSALTPGLPTVADSGLPSYESASPFALFAPAKTPQHIIDRLNTEVARVLKRADVTEKLLNAGVEVIASSPEQLGIAIKTELDRTAKLIKDVGIRKD